MSIEYWAIEDKVADRKDVPHVCVQTRKNAKKWKWIIDVDSIYIDNRKKDKISKNGIRKIFEKAREIDSEAQTPDSARYYSDRQNIWESSKGHAPGIFQLVIRDKNDAVEIADYIAETIEEEFNVEVQSA